MDEISLAGKTQVYEVKGSDINSYTVGPSDFGLSEVGPDSLKGGAADENAALLKSIISGLKGPQRDVVLANAAAALYAGDKVSSFKQGVELAGETVDSGCASDILEQLIKLTGSFA